MHPMKTLGNAAFALALAALTITLVTTSGCQRKKPISPIDPNAGDTRTTFEDTRGTGLPDLDQTRLTFQRDYDLKTIYFDYDSSALRPDALAALRENAEVMKRKPDYIFQIEGHCDERGTQEYNLALGERRALSVREHLINLGVSGDRLVTISYGEEMPAVLGSNEAAWSQNRRAEFSSARR